VSEDIIKIAAGFSLQCGNTKKIMVQPDGRYTKVTLDCATCDFPCGYAKKNQRTATLLIPKPPNIPIIVDEPEPTLTDEQKKHKVIAWLFYMNMGYRVAEDDEQEKALYDTVQEILKKSFAPIKAFIDTYPKEAISHCSNCGKNTPTLSSAKQDKWFEDLKNLLNNIKPENIHDEPNKN
jgi:hypothetical protein